MAIDASIYQNAQAPQMPSVADSMQKALTLSNLGMQNQQQQYQMQTQQAMRLAYQNNVGPDGQINRQGLIADVSRVNPQAGLQLGQQFNSMDKSQADRQTAQMAAVHSQATVASANYGYLLSLHDDQAAKAYPQMVHQLSQQGVDISNLPPTWDRNAVQQALGVANQYKEHLDNALTAANTNKANQEAGIVGVSKGAEELAKFNEDANNPSSRKTTGALIGARDRADRLVSLANAGAQPGETPQQRLNRLNQMLPQLANEYNAGLSYLFQGGQPSETQLKETGLDTLHSRIAELQQKMTGNPQAGDQGALISAYVDAAKKLRDFSAGRLKDINDRSRAAYPFANKYFPKQMDQIAAPIGAPGGGQTYGGSLAGNQGPSSGSGFIPSANASENPPAANTPAKFNAGDLVMVKGRHYRVGSDGDSLVPIQGNQ